MNLRNLLLGISLLGASALTAATHKGYIAASGGAKLYYEERGEGEPLILLHGHSLDTRMWDKQFRTFAKKYRVVRFDFRGYGRSSEQREEFQFTHLGDLLTVMDSLHIDRAHIVGLSMGAFVASDMLAVAPERMLSCVLASGGMKTYKGPSEPMDDAEKAKRHKEIEVLKAKGVDKMKAEWIEALIASGGSNRESMRKPLKKMIDKWNRDALFRVRSIYAANRETALRDRLDAIDTSNTEGRMEAAELREKLAELADFCQKTDDLLASGYDPKLDDGVGKNIAPLQKRKMISYEVLNSGQLKKYLNADW